MTESFFNADGTFKASEAILQIHEEAQWKIIMNKIDASKGYLKPIEFIGNGGIFKKNTQRLQAAGYTVYDVRDSFSIKFNEESLLEKK